MRPTARNASALKRKTQVRQITALATAQLPALIGLPVEAVYLLTMLSIAAFNFLFFRGRIFHPDPEPKREAMS